jgi:hypothetical protein
MAESNYEIRQLTIDHLLWANAIVMHSNMFNSPVWSVIYPHLKNGKGANKALKAGEYFVRHQIESKMSFGIFDKSYKFKKSGSAAKGGKLYWDEAEDHASGDDLLEMMDFPLVSVALSYDGANGLDSAQMLPLVQMLPLFGTINHVLSEVLDTRDPETWKAKAPGEVLTRNATATRQDYEGKRTMKVLAFFLMRKAAEEGYRGISIYSVHDAVAHVWTHPPDEFKAEIVASFDTATYEAKNEQGEKVKPFFPAKQTINMIYVNLK